jgi:hypothetical protein
MLASTPIKRNFSTLLVPTVLGLGQLRAYRNVLKLPVRLLAGYSVKVDQACVSTVIKVYGGSNKN